MPQCKRQPRLQPDPARSREGQVDLSSPLIKEAAFLPAPRKQPHPFVLAQGRALPSQRLFSAVLLRFFMQADRAFSWRASPARRELAAPTCRLAPHPVCKTWGGLVVQKPSAELCLP